MTLYQAAQERSKGPWYLLVSVLLLMKPILLPDHSSVQRNHHAEGDSEGAKGCPSQMLGEKGCPLWPGDNHTAQHRVAGSMEQGTGDRSYKETSENRDRMRAGQGTLGTYP